MNRMDGVLRKVRAEVGSLEEEIVATLRRLVRIPSVVGEEAEAQGFLEELYRTLGLQVVRVLPDLEAARQHPAFIDSGMSYRDRFNILGFLEGDATRPSLMLNGHVDVVSPEPVRAWTHDPWGSEIAGGMLYGRGAADMKAGLLANFFALKALLQAGLKPQGRVSLASVIDEEAGGAGGTLTCLLKGFTADAMICTEPHHLNITVAHAGVSHFRIRVRGRSIHGGLAHLGVNAIGKMYVIYQALEALDRTRGGSVRFPLFEKGSGRSCHLSVGTMKAGDWSSTVAGEAEIEGRVSFVPGESLAEIKQLIEATVLEASRKDDWLREYLPEVEWVGWQDGPWYQDPSHPFVQTFKSAAEDALGREVDFIGRAAGLDTRFAPHFGMAAACTGPRGYNIHGIDEHVELSSVFDTVSVLAATLLRWCGYDD